MAKRAELMKYGKNIQLDKYYTFSIPMSWTQQNEQENVQNQYIHMNQQMHQNRMDYILQRYNDWILYRTNWFMQYNNMHFGPELALIGNSKILWTTADETKLFERELMLGITKYESKEFRLPKTDAALFITGTMDGEIHSEKCSGKNVNECFKRFDEQKSKGIDNVPYILYRQHQRVKISYTTSQAFKWNGIYDKHA